MVTTESQSGEYPATKAISRRGAEIAEKDSSIYLSVFSACSVTLW